TAASPAVSMTDIESLFAFATYRRLPSALIAMPDGCSPTSMFFTMARAAVSYTDTVPLFAMPVAGSTTTGFVPSVASPGCGRRPAQLLTYTLRPSAVAAVAYGKAPVATSVTARVVVSTIPSACRLLSATYSLPPVGLRLRPLGAEDGIDIPGDCVH